MLKSRALTTLGVFLLLMSSAWSDAECARLTPDDIESFSLSYESWAEFPVFYDPSFAEFPVYYDPSFGD